jgi:hypothetical protein
VSQLKWLVANVDGNDMCTERVSDHNCREPHTAAAIDRHPFAGLHGALRSNRAVGRGEPATQRSRCDAGNAFRQRHEIAIGVSHSDILGERSPTCETGLVLPIADMLIAAFALVADATSGDERNGHALADGGAPHIGANRHDSAGEFVARYMRKLFDVRVVPAPAVPIAAAEPSRFNSNDGAIWFRSRITHGLDSDRPTEFVIDDCFHKAFSTNR